MSYRDSVPFVKKEEYVVVAELFSDSPIKIMVADTNNAQCTLGIISPKELPILRYELVAE